MRIAITGASGFIGSRLAAALVSRGHAVRALGRTARRAPGLDFERWDPLAGHAPGSALAGIDAVVNLAGESIVQRWTAGARRRIGQSRIEGTRLLVRAMAAAARPPALLVSASAVGYYGSRVDEQLGEDAPAGAGFLAEVCSAWEREARAAALFGARVVLMRTGVALARDGGALARMLPPFRAGLGGPLGGGRQWMPWIHIEDLVEMFCFAIETPLSGPVNGVAPQPVCNAEFTRELARALHRPAFFRVPSMALRALLGEMSGILLASQRVLPRAAGDAGFPFRYPSLALALESLLRSPARLAAGSR